MEETNIVFWLLVGMALVAIWFLFSYCFRDIGEWIIGLLSDTHEQITEDEDEEE